MSQEAAEVVVTGTALHCPLGMTPAAVLGALCAGRRQVRPSTYLPRHEVAGWAAARPVAEQAVAVAHAAVPEGLSLVGVPVVCATTTADLASVEASWSAFFSEVAAAPSLQHQLAVAPAEAVRDALATGGMAWSVSTACTSGAVAVVQAAELLQAGLADAVMVVGVDRLCALTELGFQSLRLRAAGPSRPLDVARDGLMLGEAAAAMVLETRGSAIRRGARVEATLRGWGLASDAHNLSQPHPAGRGLRRAVQESCGGRPDAVIAHATGTPHNDAVEARVLADLLPGVPVTATKGALGHTLGPAALVDAVLAVACLHAGRVPAVVGLQQRLAGIDAVLQTRAAALDSVLCTSAAFGGSTAALWLGREDAWS